MDRVGRVSLLGAGPGDPELITMRALRRLQRADLVLYDALVHPDLLRHCRADAECVFVGKRSGRPSARQAAINDRMVAAAKAGREVVRLKGGDPYLFGRGSEEAEVLARHGIPFEVVPGVPSPVAAAAYAGISLTHRQLSSSIAYITATESPQKDRSAHDWSRLATGVQTLVIFMGLRKLEHLMQLLVDHGRPPQTPAAVVQWASLPRQRTVVGTVGDLAAKVREAGLDMPALTIVGEAVQLRDALRWFDRLPLFGKRVLVTRPAHQGADFARMLRDAGAEPVRAPTIRIVPPEDPAPLQRAVAALAGYDWVVVTSRNGVDALLDELDAQGGDGRRLGGVRLCAIGPKTAERLSERGLRADVVPTEYRGEAAADAVLGELGPGAQGARVLLPRAREAREVLPERLRQAGATVDVVEAYRTEPPPGPECERLRTLFAQEPPGVVTFTSSSTVRHLVQILGADGARLAHATVASIGPITTETARQLGLRVDVTAARYTVEGLLEALCGYFAADRRPE